MTGKEKKYKSYQKNNVGLLDRRSIYDSIYCLPGEGAQQNAEKMYCMNRRSMIQQHHHKDNKILFNLLNI